MDMVSCPYCGNPKIETKSQEDRNGSQHKFGYCSVCEQQIPGVYSVIEYAKGSTGDPLSVLHSMLQPDYAEIADKYGQDFADYARKNFRSSPIVPIWQIFLWADDGAPNLTPKNLEKCQQLYDREPNDTDNLLRLMILKIFAGTDYKELFQRFVVCWKKREVDLNFWSLWRWEHPAALEEPYVRRLGKFLRELMEADPRRYKEGLEEDWALSCHSEVVGMSELSRFVSPEDLLLKQFDFRWDDQYMQYYALAKYYYSEEKWFEAFCLFEKLRTYNLACKVTNEDLSESFGRQSLEFFSDILCSCPTVDEIEGTAWECLGKINLSEDGQRGRLQNLIDNLYVNAWEKQRKTQNAEGDIENYLKIYTLLTGVLDELSKGRYEEAFSKWVKWDKSNVKMIGLDVWETTQRLKKFKEGIGAPGENMGAFLSDNYFVKYASCIFDVEAKLREFIVENLRATYSDDDKAWTYGVPQEIRIECRKKQEQAGDSMVSQWGFLDFSDYVEIIRSQNNFTNIFKKYLIFGKNDVRKSKKEATSFLARLIFFRNTIFHQHRQLDEMENKELVESAALVDKIYKKWKEVSQ